MVDPQNVLKGHCEICELLWNPKGAQTRKSKLPAAQSGDVK